MPRASSSSSELLPGTLDMLVLQTLTLQSMHGYAIAQHIRRLSDSVLSVEQGSLYPALERLQRKGWSRQNGVRRRRSAAPATTPLPPPVESSSATRS